MTRRRESRSQYTQKTQRGTGRRENWRAPQAQILTNPCNQKTLICMGVTNRSMGGT
nr:MAG: ORF3 [Torque teno polar bear virus 47]